jgi:transcriptional regulator with XRE-family HTH domain
MPATSAVHTAHASFGPLLRRWRQSRGLSQEKLAEQAEVSPRHLSFLENGRSAPSREMVLVLAGTLDLPLRDQNALLGSAGFSAAFTESALESRELSMVRRALDRLLAKQEPYPAIVVDPAWNVSRMNQGAQRLFSWALAGRQPPPEVLANAMRATLHPEGLRHVIVGWLELAGALIARTRRDLDHRPDPRVEALLREVLEYPDVPRGISPNAVPPGPFLPVHVRRDDVELRFFTTLTTLGTPLDVTAQEVHIESYFPADDATEKFVYVMAGQPS